MRHFHLIRTCKLFCTLAFFFCAIILLFAARDLQVTVTPSTPVVGSTAQLKISSTDAGRMSISSGMPAVAGIRWSNGISRNSSMSIINGRRTSEYALTCTFMPTQEGTVVIPSIDVNVDGVTMKTKPYTLTIRPAPTLREVKSSPDTVAFAEVLIPGVERDQNASYYLGEEFPVQFVIYIRDEYQIELEDYPAITADDSGMTLKFHDFRKENPRSPNFESIVTGRQIINRSYFRTYTFTTRMRALSAGTFRLQAEAQTSVLGSVNRGFFSNFPTVIGEKLFSDKMDSTITILPLPEPPAGTPYIGAMTEYEPELTLSKAPYRVGDPMTLKIVLSNCTNAEALTAPVIDFRQFRIYPPETKLQGENIEISYTLIPLESGDIPLEFSFCTFNLKDKQYHPIKFSRTISVEAASAGIKGGTNSPSVIVPDSEILTDTKDKEKRNAPQNILYLHDNLQKGVSVPLYVNHLDLFIFFPAIGLLALAICAIFALRGHMVGHDESALRRKNASVRRSALFRKLEKTDPQNLPDEASAELSSYLNDMLNLSPGTPLHDIADAIGKQAPELAEDLKKLADCTWVPAMKSSLDSAFRSRLITHLKKMFVFAVCMLAFPLFSAENNSTGTILSQDGAKNAYDSGDFHGALSFYESKMNETAPSPDVLYNIGNCLFQLGDYPRALVFYERARFLNPRSSDIVGNLNLTRCKLLMMPKYRIESPADFFRAVLDVLRMDEWCVGIAFAVMILLFSASLYLMKRRTSGKILLIGGLAVFMLCGGACIGKILTDNLSESAIIVTKNTPVYSLPSEKSGNVEQYLKSGEEVEIAEVRMDWTRIRFNKSGEGWIRSADMLPFRFH